MSFADSLARLREAARDTGLKTKVFVEDLVEILYHFARPDFDAIRDKRMCDLTPAQRDDAHELWLREQLGWMPEYHREHYQFLLRRLDEARTTIANDRDYTRLL